MVRYCHQRKNLEKKIFLSSVIAWYGFIKGIVSFTWISERAQYSQVQLVLEM